MTISSRNHAFNRPVWPKDKCRFVFTESLKDKSPCNIAVPCMPFESRSCPATVSRECGAFLASFFGVIKQLLFVLCLCSAWQNARPGNIISLERVKVQALTACPRKLIPAELQFNAPSCSIAARKFAHSNLVSSVVSLGK